VSKQRLQTAFPILFARTGIGRSEKRIFFGFGAGIFSLPLAFADRGVVFTTADFTTFAFPLPFAICGCATQLASEAQRETKPHHHQVSHRNRNNPPLYSYLLDYSPGFLASRQRSRYSYTVPAVLCVTTWQWNTLSQSSQS